MRVKSESEIEKGKQNAELFSPSFLVNEIVGSGTSTGVPMIKRASMTAHHRIKNPVIFYF